MSRTRNVRAQWGLQKAGAEREKPKVRGPDSSTAMKDCPVCCILAARPPPHPGGCGEGGGLSRKAETVRLYRAVSPNRKHMQERQAAQLIAHARTGLTRPACAKRVRNRASRGRTECTHGHARSQLPRALATTAGHAGKSRAIPLPPRPRLTRLPSVWGCPGRATARVRMQSPNERRRVTGRFLQAKAASRTTNRFPTDFCRRRTTSAVRALGGAMQPDDRHAQHILCRIRSKSTRMEIGRQRDSGRDAFRPYSVRGARA